MYVLTGVFDNTTIGEMLKKHNLTNKQFFESPINKNLYHHLFDNTDISKYITCYL